MPQGALRAAGPLSVTPRSGLVTSVGAVVLTTGEGFWVMTPPRSETGWGCHDCGGNCRGCPAGSFCLLSTSAASSATVLHAVARMAQSKELTVSHTCCRH